MKTSEQVLDVIKALMENPDVGDKDDGFLWVEADGRDSSLVDRIRERLPNLSKRQIIGAIGYLAKARKIECDLENVYREDGGRWGPHSGLWGIVYLPNNGRATQ